MQVCLRLIPTLNSLEPITQFSPSGDGSSWDESSVKPGPLRKVVDTKMVSDVMQSNAKITGQRVGNRSYMAASSRSLGEAKASMTKRHVA